MGSHLLYLSVFSLAVGMVLGMLLRRDRGDAVRLGLAIAGGMVAVAVVAAWAMHALAP